MKKSIQRVCILSILLIIISTIVILTMGKTYTLKYKITENEPYKLEVEENNGQIEIVNQRIENDELHIKIKGKKSGKVYINIDFGSFNQGELIYVHRGNIITTNNYLGRSTCSEIIPISLSIISISIIYLLIKRYNFHKKENLYQYKNIAYLGMILFLSFFTLGTIISTFDYHGLADTISQIITSPSLVSFYLLPVFVVTFILVTISNINLIRKEGLSLRNLLGLFLGIFLCVTPFIPDQVYKILLQSQAINIFNLNGPGPYIYNFIEALVYLTITYLECILIGTIIIAIKSVKRKIAYNKDYMIILGCQIKKDGTLTPLLKGRVDRALEFRNEQLAATKNDLIFIPSGGKGSDEIISEGEAMKNYLLEQGIKEKNILVEDKSKSTYENISFSNKLVKKKNANIAFSTTNYHVLRAGLIATEQGLLLEGIGSKTKTYFWINAFIREFIGTLYSERKKHIIVFTIIIINILIMIGLTYIINNI